MLHRKFIVFSFLFAGILLLVSFSSNPPQGRTGAPDERTCATSGCHSGSNPGIQGQVLIEGLPREIAPGETYSLVVKLITEVGSPVRGGLQMTALDQDLNSAGVFANPGENSTISESNNRIYFEHQPAKNFNGADELVYNVDWTAPESLSNTLVAFYGAANFANGNGSASNDRIVTFSDTVSAAQNTLTVSIAATNVTCNGANDGILMASGTGGTEPYTYEWSTDSNTPTIENLAPDTYSVTVMDSEGNQAEASATINEPELLRVQIEVVDEPSCEMSPGNLNAIGTGGTGSYLYQWSNGIGTVENNSVAAGTYTVSILDDNGCRAQSTVILTGRDLVPPTISVDSTIIFSLTTETAVFDLTFDQIDQGSSDNCGDIEVAFSKTSFDCSNIGDNEVTLTITDGSGNRSQKSIVVSVEDIEPPVIFCVDELNISSCATFSYPLPSAEDNCSDAQVRFVSGLGTNASFPIGQSIEIYEARDASGNATQCTIVINNNPIIDANIQVTDISCHGESDGSITADITGNNEPYSFFNSDMTTGLNDLSAGFYTIVIQDNSGCEFMRTVEVTEPDSLIINVIEVENSLNANSGDGSITVEVAGGNPPYDFEWRTEDEIFSTDQNLDLLFVGSYQLFVTDANGCIAATDTISIDATVSVNDPDLIAAYRLFPNPVTDVLYIESTNEPKEMVLMQIFDLQGREVHRSIDQSAFVDLSTLSVGVYFLQLTFDDHRRLSHQLLKIKG